MAAKIIDKVLIRKIRFGKKNIRTQPKVIKFDPWAPDTRTRDETSFEKLCENLQNCLPSSSFFLFHDIKSTCGGNSFQSASNNRQIDPQEVPFTDNYDIATHRFKSIGDEYVANLATISEEIIET